MLVGVAGQLFLLSPELRVLGVQVVVVILLMGKALWLELLELQIPVEAAVLAAATAEQAAQV
jgi:hypothetical protein